MVEEKNQEGNVAEKVEHEAEEREVEEHDLSEEEIAKLEEIVEENKGQQGVLINTLHKVQQEIGYLPREAQLRVAQGLDIPFSKVYSVISFYSLFTTSPSGEYTVEVCTGTACYVKGAEDILDELKEELGIEPEGTTEDGLFTLKTTRCIGACGMAPVVIIGDDVKGRIEAGAVPELLDGYK